MAFDDGDRDGVQGLFVLLISAIMILELKSAVVFADASLENAIEFNDYYHKLQPPFAFIKTEVRGLFGNIFCDFGLEFTVTDVDGEDPHTGIIASISNDNPTLVSCVDDERLEFQDGDLVVLSEIKGMTELNDGKPRKIKNAQPHSFNLDEGTTNFGTYKGGGIVTQVKQPKFLNVMMLKEALEEPGEGKLTITDDDVIEKSNLIWQFLFCAWNIGQAKSTLITNDSNQRLGGGKLQDINPKRLTNFGFGARAVLNLLAAMPGGIFGPEVMKACAGKFHPLFQFFYFDSVKSLPSEPLEASDFRPLNSRYDAQISVFGSKFQKKLQDAQLFSVGSGALGCKFLKNLALIGVSCTGEGKLTITDDDAIEKSYLNKQFLFGDWNIGQAKSTVAASINPNFHVEALQNRFGPETGNLFHDAFWENLTVVINALDIVNARLYVDQRCLYFQKPLLESRTLGAKCNTQMVIPHLTENYGASRDTPEKQAPICLNIDHCLTWARSEFEGLLEKTPAEDDDTNYDMDLIAALTNMRARNYSILEVDRLKAKFIAGRIIPAIAKSTAMTPGLVCLELYKVIDGGHKLEDYRNTFANLSLPLFSMAEPVPPKVVKHQDLSWTVWDRWMINANPALRELLQWLAKKGLNSYSISCGSYLLYNRMFPRHKERMDKKVVDLAGEVAKVEIPSYGRHLDVVACEDDEDNDIDIPLISIYFR